MQVSMWTKGSVNCFSIPTYFSSNYHHHCTSNPLVVRIFFMKLDSLRQKSWSLWMSGSSNTLRGPFGGYFFCRTDEAAQVRCPQRGMSHHKYQFVPAYRLQGNLNVSSEIKKSKHRTKSHTERRSIIGQALTHHELTHFCNSFFSLALKHICYMSSDLIRYIPSDLRPQADFGT